MLGVLVLIHEGGHYLAARAFKVGIMEFSIGMGPVLYKKKGKYNDFSIKTSEYFLIVFIISQKNMRNKSILNKKYAKLVIL